MLKVNTDTLSLLDQLKANGKRIEAQNKRNDRKMAKLDRKFKQLITQLGGFTK